MKKNFLRTVSTLVALMLIFSVVSVGVSAASYAPGIVLLDSYGGVVVKGEPINIDVTLYTSGLANEHYTIKVINDKGATVARFNGAFPEKVGVSSASYSLDTTYLADGEYYVEAHNMTHSSKIEEYISCYTITSYACGSIYTQTNENASAGATYNYNDCINVDYGDGYFDVNLSTMYNGPCGYEGVYDNCYGVPAKEPSGKHWLYIGLDIYNGSDEGIYTADIFQSNLIYNADLTPVSKSGEIQLYESRTIYNQGYVEPYSYLTVYLACMVPDSSMWPIIPINIGDGVVYLDTNIYNKHDSSDNVYIEYSEADGVYYSMKDGNPINYDGFVAYNSSLCYVNEGVAQLDLNGICHSALFNNGLVDSDYNGLYYDEDYGYYYVIKDGFIDENVFGFDTLPDGTVEYFMYGKTGYTPYGIEYFDGEYIYYEDGVQSDYTGFEWYDNLNCYVVNGKVVQNYTGLAYCEEYDEYYYVDGGFVDYDYTGLCYYNGTWWYIYNGVLDFNFDGAVEYGGQLYYVENGQINWGYEGVCYYDGENYSGNNYYYFQGGQRSYATTLAYYDYDLTDDEAGVWYYMVNGERDYDYEGYVQYYGTYYYVANGRLANGLYYTNGDYYYFTDGLVNWNCDTIDYYEYYDGTKWVGADYYCYGGKIAWGFTGLAKDGYYTDVLGNRYDYWVAVVNGVVDYNYTGLINHYGTWYSVKNGYISYEEDLIYYGGAYYYVNNGVIDWNCNTLVYYGGTWWHAEYGSVNFASNTLVNYGGAWYKTVNGQVDWGYTGLVEYYGSWYYVQNGSINWNATTLVQYGGNWYYVENGVLNWNGNGAFYYNGAYYNVVNGVVVF